MQTVEDLVAENAALRERLSRFAETGIRINESLELDAVLQGVLDSARALTNARYAVITVQWGEDSEWEYLSSGMTADESDLLWKIPDAEHVFELLNTFQAPTRIKDLRAHLDNAGFDQFTLPVADGISLGFMAVPVSHMGRRVGSIFVAAKLSADGFTHEDEETLEMLASQAALVIANARAYRSERRARDGLETLINTSPVGVIVFDAQKGVPISFNREAVRIVGNLLSSGQAPEDLMHTVTVVRADGREMRVKDIPVPGLLSSDEKVRVEEIVLKVPDGRSISTLLNASPIRADDGTVESFIVTMQDLTPIQNLERLRAEFLGIVSHELRAPLTAVKGSATTLIQDIEELESAEMLQFFKIIDEQTDRMRDLIGELLQVAQIETGTLSVRPEPSEPASLIDEAKSRFINGGGRGDVSIDLDRHLPGVIADRRRVVQVLNNLLSNAEKFSPRSSPIQIAATQKGPYVEISVADRGEGFSENERPNFFGKFARHAAREGGGVVEDSGLGLAICKGIVEAHGGRIWATSDGRGTGSTFSFTLPAFQPETADRSDGLDVSTADAQRETQQGELPRILVIDDDPQVLRQVRKALEKEGYAPLVTGDPEEAMSLIIKNEPGLILLDLLLPGTNGIELMERITLTVDVPVVFLSAYRQDEVVAKAFELGAADYIVKPFSESELLARIGAALRKPTSPRILEPQVPYFRNGLQINFAERKVSVSGRPVELTATESRLLFQLATNAGRVLTYDDLLSRIWGPKRKKGRGMVRTVVKRIRQKLDDSVRDPKHIFTEHGIGFRMLRPGDDGE